MGERDSQCGLSGVDVEGEERRRRRGRSRSERQGERERGGIEEDFHFPHPLLVPFSLRRVSQDPHGTGFGRILYVFFSPLFFRDGSYNIYL